MNGIRMWLALLLVWLSVLFNLERVHEPINLASFVYVLCGLLAVSVVTISPMRRATLSWLVAGSIVLLVVLKALMGYPLAGTSLPLTITEAVAVTASVILAHQIARHIRQFEESAAKVAAVRWSSRPKSFDEGQADMYRELRRARRFGRPLAVVALEPTSESMDLSIDRLIEEVRREMVQRYVEVRLADVLQSEVQDCDQVTNFGGRFILLLPETGRENAEVAMRRVARRVERELGLKLNVGAAAFPDDEITLTGLVESAEAGMAGKRPETNGHVRAAVAAS